MHILLVEDNPINQLVAQRFIDKRVDTAVVASSGSEALAILESQPFDLILMNIQMREMSGIEVTAAIREKEKGTRRHIPIIATTASAMKEDKDRFLDAGMDAFLSKPIDRKELFETMDMLINSSKVVTHRNASALNTNPAFDMEAVLESLDQDFDLLLEIVGISLTQLLKHMQGIQDAIAKEDSHALEHAAHAMKGTAANLLAVRVMETASKLEEMGRIGTVAGSNEAFLSLEIEMTMLQLALREFEKESAQSRRSSARKIQNLPNRLFSEID